MATESKEVKAAEAAFKESEKIAADEKKQAEAEKQVSDKHNEADAEETRLRLAAASAAASQTEADNAARERAREDARLKVVEEVRESAESDDFAGQLVSTEHFIVASSAPNATKSITIRPVGWVGDDVLRVSADQIDELAEALGKIKK